MLCNNDKKHVSKKKGTISIPIITPQLHDTKNVNIVSNSNNTGKMYNIPVHTNIKKLKHDTFINQPSSLDTLYDTAIEYAFYDRDRIKNTLNMDTEIEFRFKLPNIPSQLFRNVKCTSYNEIRYFHPDFPHTKIRQRSDTSMISKTHVSKYSLEPHWCTLCVSIESPYEIPSHRLFRTSEVRVEQYIIPIEDVAIVDIKHFLTGHIKDNLEIEFLSYDNRAKRLVKNAIKNILELCIKPYMNRLVFDEETIPFDINKYPKPITLKRSQIRDIFTKHFYVTIKNDGERVILLLRNKILYEATAQRPYFYPIAKNTSSYTHMIIDCERVNGVYNILDYDDFSNNTFKERLPYFGTIFSSNIMKIKKYSKITSIEDVIAYWKMEGHPKNDGLLIIDGNRSYSQSLIYKWKYKNTIDLLVKNNSLYMYGDVKFTLLDCDTQMLEDNVIYEFMTNRNASYIVPVRKRDDKLYPNSWHVVRSNMYYGVTLDDIIHVGCRSMRRYHNYIKQKCIDDIHTDILVDIGTGRGIDISKWDSDKMVYCIEPDTNRVIELRRKLSYTTNRVIIPHKINDNVIDLLRDKLITVTTFFCLNLFDNNDFKQLSNLFEAVRVDTWYVIFMDHKKLVETFGYDRYVCTDYHVQVDMKSTYLDIPKSNINDLIENALTLDEILKKVPSMHLVSSHYLTDEDHLLSENQDLLSRCYMLAILKSNT